jgi:Xaa-Pro dipeptidase
MNACGYSLGTTFAPTWMDWPMFYADNPAVIQPNMIYFLHMILFDSENSFAMTLGETFRVTENGSQKLSRHGLDLLVA